MPPSVEPGRARRDTPPPAGTREHGDADARGRAHPAASGGGDYDVRLEPLPPLARLQPLWRELECRADASFFLSWRWIGHWLTLICPHRYARLVSVHRHGRLVALGVFTVRRRWLGLGPMHLRLHEVGDKRLDSLTIEYNGLLCERGQERDALAAVVHHLTRANRRWLTFYLPGVDVDRVPLERIRSGAVEMRMRTRATHYVDLAALRESGHEYLSSVLSSKARSAVRRTARKLESRFGPVTATLADTPAKRLSFFHALVRLHELHWTYDQDEPGAFGDPRIRHFHEMLIAESTQDEGAQLIRLDAGGRPVGYVYNLVWRGVVYFYQAGIDYPNFGGCGSPGLLLLTRAIERAQADGHARFELMAGDADYKRTLGMAEGKMVWLSLDRIGWTSRLRRAWWSLTRRDG